MAAQDVTTDRTSRQWRGLRYCVAYQPKNRRPGEVERYSAWFADRDRAEAARAILARRHGGACIVVD